MDITRSRSRDERKRRALIERAKKMKRLREAKEPTVKPEEAREANVPSSKPETTKEDTEDHCKVSDDDDMKRLTTFYRNLKKTVDVTWIGYKSTDEDSVKTEFTEFLVSIFGSEGKEKFVGDYSAKHSKFTCRLTQSEVYVMRGQEGVKTAEVIRPRRVLC